MRLASLPFALVLALGTAAQSTYDAAIVDYVGLKYPCDGEVVPTLRIQNQGTATMGTCVVETWKNGAIDNSFNWVLAVPAVTGATRQPALPVITGVQPGDILEFRIISVNTIPDEDATDNIRFEPIDGTSELSASYLVKVEVFTDGDPQETTWKILNATGAVVADGGPYADPNTVVEEWVPLAPTDCYSFRVDDSGGNGMDQRALPGYVKVVGLGSTVIEVGGSDFTDSYEEGLRSGSDPCGVTRLTTTASPVVSCGDALYPGSTIHADPVPGADRYQWEFTRSNYLRRIASPGPSLVLGPWATKPLQPGRSYTVKVRPSFDNGATWCPFGAPCSIYLAHPPPALSPRSDQDLVDAPLDLVAYPNPGTGDAVRLRIGGLADASAPVDIRVLDLQGRLLLQRPVVATDGQELHLAFPQALAPGLYLLRADAEGRSVTARYVVE